MTAPLDDPNSAAFLDWQRVHRRLLAYERALLSGRPVRRLTDAVLAEWTDLRRLEIACRYARRAAPRG